MNTTADNAAAEFITRKKKNLEYFKVALPRVYQLIENSVISRAELVVTPGREDLDMVVDGKSCYRGIAKEYSRDEALKFLKDNSPDNPLLTFPPEWPSESAWERFATQRTQEILKASPLTRERFRGYVRGSNFFPSVVFLGVGLGYHIELVATRSDIASAFVVERDPEKFALSLFTVDWASICSRFQRRGRSINFVIGFEGNDDKIKELLSAHLRSAVPVYPYLCLYYNHLADVKLAEAVREVSNDLALVAANWTNYDDQLIRLKNTQFNLAKGMAYLKARPLSPVVKPLVVVGSGPSIDQRIKSLQAVRDQVVIISAGTGLRPLLVAGIRPDLHVEMDPSYSIFEMHSDAGEDALKDIPLVAANEINPHVPKLFGKTRYIFKSDNAVPGFLGLAGDGFPRCNPTCTNAALSIGYQLGFRNIFMFGTDYGFESRDKDHASTSIHGDEAKSEFARKLQQRVSEHKHTFFKVPSVSGGEVWTRVDYYTAGRSVEALLSSLEKNDSSVRVFNCADGALIKGATWQSSEQFEQAVREMADDEYVDLASRMASIEGLLESDIFETRVDSFVAEMRAETGYLARMIEKAKLKGAKDFTLFTNEIRYRLTPGPHIKSTTGNPSNLILVNQMIQGTVLRLVHHGLTHALGCEDGKTRGQFVERWRRLSVNLLRDMPNHMERVLKDGRSWEANPWSTTGIRLAEPEWSEL